jgi:hypothetical protein
MLGSAALICFAAEVFFAGGKEGEKVEGMCVCERERARVVLVEYRRCKEGKEGLIV